MKAEPPVPNSIPEIPRGPLWWALAFPPLITAGANALIGLLGGGTVAGELTFLLLLAVFAVILGFTYRFNCLVARRYRGKSLAFLTLAYFMGQIIICLALWIGTCVMFFPAPNFH